MPTLYVENVPETLYEAIRDRAQQNRSSISTEVLKLLADNVPTPEELARRKALLKESRKFVASRAAVAGAYPTAEQMVREDRSR